ncbi:MAG: 1-acyl-sn-glycerol-3-phosphate acyltransferase [Akkermansiaceae bacterium]|jgi:hypothetical protein
MIHTTTHPHVRPSFPASWIERIVPPDRIAPAWETTLHHMTWSLIRFGIIHRHQLTIEGAEIPVIPCHIQGAFDAWPSNRKLPGKGSLHLQVGTPRTFASHSGTTDGWRAIAQELEQDVRQLAHSAYRRA